MRRGDGHITYYDDHDPDLMGEFSDLDFSGLDLRGVTAYDSVFTNCSFAGANLSGGTAD